MSISGADLFEMNEITLEPQAQLQKNLSDIAGIGCGKLDELLQKSLKLSPENSKVLSTLAIGLLASGLGMILKEISPKAV